MSSFLKKLGILPADTQHDKEASFRGILEWDHSASPGMVYHTSADLPFLKIILVRPYESAIFLRDGKIYATLPEGRWVVEKMPILGKMEIIWVATEWQKVRFGLRTLTRDGVEIGAHGAVYLKVSDPQKFITNLVAARKLFSADDLEDFLSEQMVSVLRAEMARYEIQALYIERDMFSAIARAKLAESYDNLGLEFQTLEVWGFALPDDVKAALQSVMIAEKEAKVVVAVGTAQAEVLSRIRKAGVDPVELKAAEALMKYAEKPGGAAGGTPALVSSDLLMPLVFYGLLMKDKSISPDIKNQIRSLLPHFSEKAHDRITTEQSPPVEQGKTKATDRAEYDREQINNILDQLDERLAKGQITEKTYSELKEKWAQKLNELNH